MERIERSVRVIGGTREKFANDLKRRYERGESIWTLAADCVHRILSENGVRFRGRGGTSGSHDHAVVEPVTRLMGVKPTGGEAE
jgi:hypothetical protein